MKNMSPSVTRPGIVKTKVVSQSPITSKALVANKSPCQCESMAGDSIKGGEVTKDVVHRPARTVFHSGF